jgi:G:T/U-mismatch repair DNA glycosylase
MIERHQLVPFLPPNAKILMLGSFPPPKQRWCIDFFYPNYINDMWRIMGLIFFNDKNRFCILDEKKFDREAIIKFCNDYGIAIFDTASAVIRHKSNASDKFLEIVEPTNIYALLEQIPNCHAVVTTGEKASATLVETFNCDIPKVGSYIEIHNPQELRFYRMPSSSRAYPMKLEDKAKAYKKMFDEIVF